jgi:putative RNA 2'-phosphotransferase
MLHPFRYSSMSDLTAISKRISYQLRHSDIAMDTAGWARIDDLLERTGISHSILSRVVESSDKKRFELDGDRIRACQGHSALQIDPEALEESWEPIDPRGRALYHGTMRKNVASILLNGLMPITRTHVHLAPAKNSVVGKRHNVDTLVEVSGDILADLHVPVYQAPNGVILVESVPPNAIAAVESIKSREVRRIVHGPR